MNKKIAIIGYGKDAVDTYGKQITALFSNNLSIEKFYIDESEIRKRINADLILVQSYHTLKKVKPYLNLESKIVFANRTISKAGFCKIMNIPKGTHLGLLDESMEMAIEMVCLLYELGIKHIEIAPIYPGIDKNIRGKTLILLGKSTCNTEGAEKIINIGHSLLDISTIIDIGEKLNLLYILQNQNIRMGYKEIVSKNFGLSHIIGQTNRFESELKILLQVLNDGIIGIDPKGRIYTYNEGAEEIIGVNKDNAMGKNIIDLMPDISFEMVLKNIRPIKERLIKIKGYDVVLSAHPLVNSGILYGVVIIIKKFNDIEKKQYRFRAQIIGQGYRAKYKFEDIFGESEIIKKYKEIARRMANSDSSILITGESGTGKELFAQAIHNSSKRREYPFVAVNCAAITESLLESELFGYEEGAFTGARKGGKPGLFELAHKGTLFLDEIGEMPLNLQTKLLRVLQEREVMRIGGSGLIKVDIRIISVTNRNLKDMIDEGKFREDLYYRLSVLPLNLPPLRYRREDIIPLLNDIKDQLNVDFILTKSAEDALTDYNWKGNIRELKNYIEYFASLGIRKIDLKDLPFYSEKSHKNTLDNSEKIIFKKFLSEAHKDMEKYIFLLEELNKGFKNEERMGRRSLYKIARQKNIFLSEQEIRVMLIELEKNLMIKMNRGRGGSVITKFGEKVLNYLKDNVLSEGYHC
ncbi:sigma 54-interacting transcriptional regulator [Clostridium sp. Mt-5]|uniref:Sigma 54-interacting transcriptional regulator n=1 Tax=Clostridium moutaii TaxID=3240932 RepID=A0ABV4BMG8_9CLOT